MASNDESDNSYESYDEESTCGRWTKMKKEVQQREIPGTSGSYLAMDLDLGIEVVWNDVFLSMEQSANLQMEELTTLLNSRKQLKHPNIVKFHEFWRETNSDYDKIVFITESVTCGTIGEFLHKIKNQTPLQTWKAWCSYILSALRYLHTFIPPITHGNLTVDTIFIQHNGVIKIGSVNSELINNNLRAIQVNHENEIFIAPEIKENECYNLTPAVDIYAFGICALKVINKGIPLNSEFPSVSMSHDLIEQSINSISDPAHKDFIRKCLHEDPKKRPSAQDLLLHEAIFEFPSLKLLSAHAIVSDPEYHPYQFDNVDLDWAKKQRTDFLNLDVLAFVPLFNGKPGKRIKRSSIGELNIVESNIEKSNVTKFEIKKLNIEKICDEARAGVYPITVCPFIHPSIHPFILPLQTFKEPNDLEDLSQGRERIKKLKMTCNVECQKDSENLLITLTLTLDETLNESLCYEFSSKDSSSKIVQKFIENNYIVRLHGESVERLIREAFLHKRDTKHSVNASLSIEIV